MITWKFALMMLFGISNSLPMQSAKETKPKAENKATEVKVVEGQKIEAKNVPVAKADVKVVEGKKIDVKNVAVAKTDVKVVEGKKIEAKNVAVAKADVKVVEGKKIDVKNVIVAKADEPKVILQDAGGIKVDGVKIEIPRVELRQITLPKVDVAAPAIKVEGIKIEPKIENVKVLLKKVEEPKVEAVKAENIKVLMSKVDPANAITLKKLDGSLVTGTGTITVTQAEGAKAGTPHTFTITQVAPKGEEGKKEAVKTAIIKAVGDDSKAHIIQVQILPSGEVKVIQDDIRATAAPADAKALILKKVEAAKAGEEKALILKKLEAAKVGEETAKAVKNVMIAQAQAKAEEVKAKADEAKAKAEKYRVELDKAKADPNTKTIELRIEIKGDGPPKVEVIGTKERAIELRTETRKIELPRRVEEMRRVEEVRKVEGRMVEAAKAAPGAKPNTASIVINGETKTFPLPGTTASGVMKLVISEDGKGFKVESDGKAKTEVLELQKVLKAADDAQAQALTLRKKAEELRAQALKEAENAKQLQLKYSGDMKDLNKKLEGRIVESRARIASDGDKIEQLNKRMEKIEKMIEELAKKVK